MRFAAFSRIAACIVGFSCSFAPMTSEASNCKCPKNPGPGGGVQCAKDQVATCDATSGVCNCTCDSVQAGKTKAEYEAQIFSQVLHTKVDPDELSSPQYGKFVSSFRKSNGDKGTFTFDKETGAGRGRQVTVGVPEWLEGVLAGRGGVSIGAGASIQIPPGTTIEATTNAPDSAAVGINTGTVTVNPPVNSNAPTITYNCAGDKKTAGQSPTAMMAMNAEFGKESKTLTRMVELNSSNNFPALLEVCEEKMKSAPEWLTPYLFCSLGYLSTGDMEKARETLAEYDKRTGPAYASEPCKQIAEHLHSHM